MKRIRFVFYLAKFEWRNVFKKGRKIRLFDDGISLWTGLFNWFTPGYSHWSGWIAGKGKLADSSWRGVWVSGDKRSEQTFYGTCYTSTMRGDDNGTVSRPASEVFTHPERWEYIEFEVTDESFETAKAWADKRVAGKHKYSMRDIRRFFMPLWMLKKFKWDDPLREICSEHGEGWATRLQVEPIEWKAWGIRKMLNEIQIRSPRRLWRDLVKRHKVPTYSLATGLRVRDESGKKVK